MKPIKALKFDSYWIDLLMLLLLMYILITTALITSLKNEYETRINLLKKQSEKVNDSFGPQTPVISIGMNKNKYFFVLELPKIGKKSFRNISDILNEIRRIHPQNLILRVDKEAPFKLPQEILIEARKLNINLGFAYEGGS